MVLVDEVDLPLDPSGNVKKSIVVITDAACDDPNTCKDKCIDRILQASKARGKEDETEDEFQEAFPLVAKASKKRNPATSGYSPQTEAIDQEAEMVVGKRGRAPKRRRVATASKLSFDRYDLYVILESIFELHSAETDWRAIHDLLLETNYDLKPSLLSAEFKKFQKFDDTLFRCDSRSSLTLASGYSSPGLMMTTPCLFLFLVENLNVSEGSERDTGFSIRDLCHNITARLCLKFFGLPDEIIDRISECTAIPGIELFEDLAVVANAIKTSTTKLSTLQRCSVRIT